MFKITRRNIENLANVIISNVIDSSIVRILSNPLIFEIKTQFNLCHIDDNRVATKPESHPIVIKDEKTFFIKL